jgi:hypothetical protein
VLKKVYELLLVIQHVVFRRIENHSIAEQVRETPTGFLTRLT